MLKNVTFNGHSFDTPDKLRSTHFYLTQERCTRIFHSFAHVAVLISRACHQNGAHSGSLALIWDNVQDYFQEKWGGEENYRPKHKILQSSDCSSSSVDSGTQFNCATSP